MKPSANDFRRAYENLSDDGLLSIDREELVEIAKQCYDEELFRRGLRQPDLMETQRVPESRETGNLVPVDSFLFPDEANIARALLKGAGIPCFLANEHTLAANWNLTFAVGGLRLLVPKPLLAEAREILESRVTDDQLSAEAAAAIPPPDPGEDTSS